MQKNLCIDNFAFSSSYYNSLMGDVEKLSGAIVQKVHHLIKKHNELQKQYSELESKHEKNIKVINDLNIEIEELKIEKNNFIITDLLTQTEEKSEVKKKIDELVREIDKSIGLLNK